MSRRVIHRRGAPRAGPPTALVVAPARSRRLRPAAPARRRPRARAPAPGRASCSRRRRARPGTLAVARERSWARTVCVGRSGVPLWAPGPRPAGAAPGAPRGSRLPVPRWTILSIIAGTRIRFYRASLRSVSIDRRIVDRRALETRTAPILSAFTVRIDRARIGGRYSIV